MTTPHTTAVSAPARLAYSIRSGAEQLGIGETLMKTLVRRGEIASVRLGRRRVIPATVLEAYLLRNLEQPYRVL